MKKGFFSHKVNLEIGQIWDERQLYSESLELKKMVRLLGGDP